MSKIKRDNEKISLEKIFTFQRTYRIWHECHIQCDEKQAPTIETGASFFIEAL
jgi:hypothetical protein